jgi:hypothetical protein
LRIDEDDGMAAQLNHTIVWSSDQTMSARFLAEMLGRPAPTRFGHFDAVLSRIRERGLEHWADPMRHRPGEINHNDGGRGVYFPGPDGHYLEVITRPYGSGAG